MKQWETHTSIRQIMGWRNFSGATGKCVRRGLLLGASVASLTAQAAPALAQEAVGVEDQPVGVETITVTARRRTESLQDTPIAISAVTAQGLEARGIDNVTQIGDFTPNVKFNSSVPISASNATAAIFIRGIGQNDYQLSADPGVGLYLDGVYISRGVGNVLDVLNVQRIEVLRGPQGTLFGRNTIGGAVSVVTEKPSATLGGKLELTTGSYNRFQAKGIVNIPLAEGVYSSLAGFIHKRDGHVKGVVAGAPDLGDTDNLAGRFALRLEPSSDLTNWAIPGKMVKGMGGAMDLVAGVKRVIVVMDHVAKDGSRKILECCSLPLTGKAVVDLIITDIAVIAVDRRKGALSLIETAPGVTAAYVAAMTGAPLIDNFLEMQV